VTGIEAIKQKMTLAELSRRLGITRGAVAQWKAKIPAERVLQVEKVTGIDRSRLRPDLFGNSGRHIAARHNSIS